MYKYLFITLFLIYFSNNVKAVEDIKFTSINNKDGLSHNTVRCVMQDKKGFVWISTMSGLNRYDGNKFIVMQAQFETPSLTKNAIKRTIEDLDGYIWIQSTSDIFDCYDPHTESFINYAENANPQEYSDIKIGSNGDVWLYGKRKGICRVKHAQTRELRLINQSNDIQNSVVNFIHEDSDKNIWIGTNRGGLFKQFANNLINYHKELNINWKDVVELTDDIYFFSENGRLSIYNKKESKFSAPISINASNASSVINAAVAITKNKILISTQKDIKVLDVETREVLKANSLFNRKSIQNSHIHIDNKDNCWIYNNTGVVWLYNKKVNRFMEYELIPPAMRSIIDLERYNIHTDSRGIAWISTYGNGLFGINLETNELNHLTTSNSEFKTNNLLSVSEDKDGNIWVGTEFTGVVKLSFTNELNILTLPSSIDKNREERIIRAVCEDRNGNVWIGTKGGKLHLYNSSNKYLETINISKGMPYSISEDWEGGIWVGTKGGGLFKIFKEAKHYVAREYNTKLEANSDNIYTIVFDSGNRMWIGTYGGGLLLGEKENDEYIFRSFPTINEIQNKIRCILEDSSGNIWIGGNNGLIEFNPAKFISKPDSFVHYSFDKSKSYSLSNNEIKALYEDANHNIWLGTSGSGISLMQKEGKFKTFKHYSTENGLINNVIQAITADNDNNIWISTEAGISKLNTSTFVFDNFSFSNNWASNLFSESVAFRKRNGNLLFGSHNGLYTINPSDIGSQQENTPITITGLEINGNPTSPNVKDSPLTKSISETSSITLNYRQNTFSINFSSLKFKDSHTERYTYVLENFDDKWNPVTSYNVATYRNIPPGKYLFKVRSYNSSINTKGGESLLEIIITPPFWKSWIALFAYFILMIVICYSVAKLISKMNKLNNQVQIEKQLTEYKLRFFTNISHEFRTPLTIIHASIENIKGINVSSQKLKKQISVLDRSSARLLKLIDQLLEFRKLQHNQLDLKLEHVNAHNFFFDIYSQFQQIANNRHINYIFDCSSELETISVDIQKVDKIVFNLLSNAFKNTPKKGTIKFSINFNKQSGVFSFNVSDSGPGIPSDKISLLFERFKPIGDNHSGIGIGLNLTKELVSVHNGEIVYNNSEWNGASFTVTLPFSTSCPNNESKNVDSIIHNNILEDVEDAIEYKALKAKMDYSILIIEDDDEIRNFLKEQLETLFTVHTSDNGLLGLEAAKAEHIDLILCDVMMPEIDGFEVTKRLKSDFETSHIPIVLLTAHSSMKHRIEGIEVGADSYITKPFSFKYLLSRIIKLIEQREKLQRKMSKDSGMVKPTITTLDKDKEFIEKVNSIIEKELANPKFTIEDFARLLNLSRTLFYKKTKSLTGHSPNEYIRIIRLNKAAEMLKTSGLNVSEIAYCVGFSDPFYFSKCFKEQFKQNPSLYRQQQTKS